MKPILVVAAVVAISLASSACAPRESTQTAEQRDSTSAAASRLERIQQEIDSLTANARAMGEQARTEFEEDIRSLHVRRDSAAAELERLRSASSEVWEKTKEGTDRTLGALEGAIAEARRRIRSRADSAATGTADPTRR